MDLSKLPAFVPWPAYPPVQPEKKPTGWPDKSTEQMFNRFLSHETRVAIELGCWCGATTQMIADRINGVIIAIDFFDIALVPEECSPRQKGYLQQQKESKEFLQRFQANLWDYRDQIFPLACSTIDGIAQVKALGDKFCSQVDFVYIDADHRWQMAKADCAACAEAFPNAVITGDDWAVVMRGIKEVAGKAARADGKSWYWDRRA